MGKSSHICFFRNDLVIYEVFQVWQVSQSLGILFFKGVDLTYMVSTTSVSVGESTLTN